MAKAILIAGYGEQEDPDRFFKRINKLYCYLNREAGLGLGNIFFIDAAPLSSGTFEDTIDTMFRRAGGLNDSGPLLLYYCGHGLEGAWCHSQSRASLPYTRLRKILEPYSGQLLIVNDCCHSLSILAYLNPLKIAQKHWGLISACASNQEQNSDLPDLFIRCWRARLPCKVLANVRNVGPDGTKGRFHDQQIVRRGAELDHLFYPNRPTPKS